MTLETRPELAIAAVVVLLSALASGRAARQGGSALVVYGPWHGPVVAVVELACDRSECIS